MKKINTKVSHAAFELTRQEALVLFVLAGKISGISEERKALSNIREGLKEAFDFDYSSLEVSNMRRRFSGGISTRDK